LVETFGVEGGFEAETIAPVTVTETTETETDNDQTTTVVTEETAPVNAAPEIDGLTAQSVQAKPQLVSHELATTTQIDGVYMDDLAIANDHPVTLTFMKEGAGYRSTVGYYKIAENGEITDVDVIFENASKVGSGGNLIPGVSAVDLDIQAGDKIAFFIVANGFRRNDFDDFVDGSYVFRDGQDTATTDSVSPDLFFVHENGEETKLKGHIYHTTEHEGAIQLNADGLSHTISSQDAETGSLTIGFESLFNLGDQNFDDLSIRVDFGPAVTETVAPVSIAPEFALDDDSDILSGAEIAITDGFISGDTLQTGNLEGTGIAIAEQAIDEATGLYKLILEGDASVEAYEAALGSVHLINDKGEINAGTREVSITVTDVEGLESDSATTSATILPTNIVTGSAATDQITGTSGNDIIDGGGDNDVIDGAGGSDGCAGKPETTASSWATTASSWPMAATAPIRSRSISPSI